MSYLQVARRASVVDSATHLEGAEGDFDPVLVARRCARPVGQPEEARAGPEAMLEAHPRPQGHVAT